MIFALSTDDKTLMIFATEAEATAMAEGIDVEDGVWWFFDELGEPLQAMFDTPNERNTFSVVSGTYSLHPSQGAGLEEYLGQVSSVEGSHSLTTIAGVQEWLTSNRSNKKKQQELQNPIKLAHPGKRFQGQFIDGLIAYFLGFVAYYVLDNLIGREPAVYSGGAIAIIYFLLSDSLPNGQSLGKKLLDIMVVDKKTLRPCTVFQSLLRNITFPLGIFDWIFIFFGSHRRLGDFIASTIVVKEIMSHPSNSSGALNSN